MDGLMLTNFINISESETQGVFDVFDNRTQFISFPHQFSTKGIFFSRLCSEKNSLSILLYFLNEKILDPIRFVYGLVDYFVLAFGIPLNFLLIYLIRAKTNSDMRRYGCLLTISCIMDLVVAVWTSLVQPVIN